MEAIEKIVEQLNQQGELERQQLKQAEITRIDQTYQAELQEIEEDHQKRLEKRIVELKNSYKQNSNRLNVSQKQVILNHKQAILERIFNETILEMEKIPRINQHEFAHNALSGLKLSGEWVFSVGEKSTSIFNEQWLDQQNEVLPYRLVRGAKISGQAGFLLDKAGVQYNFLYQSLIRELQLRESFQFAQRLFE
ncbi:hypothetical protein [Enterococcus hermanniensis]|uniref:V-type ATPase, subunit E n=1 Tax=Enterococcus hermanniensis TaxID=249189 RepID=A0A1L8TJ65_9ENTE|nr:hypothetical protein [Enterococcus hermanniensis]OJG44330.1 hypothetical protein RV04_GL000524 [Enterococcus hermanniensis]